MRTSKRTLSRRLLSVRWNEKAFAFERIQKRVRLINGDNGRVRVGRFHFPFPRPIIRF